jgi:hypothetical protein
VWLRTDFAKCGNWCGRRNPGFRYASSGLPNYLAEAVPASNVRNASGYEPDGRCTGLSHKEYSKRRPHTARCVRVPDFAAYHADYPDRIPVEAVFETWWIVFNDGPGDGKRLPVCPGGLPTGCPRASYEGGRRLGARWVVNASMELVACKYRQRLRAESSITPCGVARMAVLLKCALLNCSGRAVLRKHPEVGESFSGTACGVCLLRA